MSECLKRETSCLVPSNLLVLHLLPSNWQCGHTRVCAQLGAGTLQGTRHSLGGGGGCECCVLWLVSIDDLKQHSLHPFYP